MLRVSAHVEVALQTPLPPARIRAAVEAVLHAEAVNEAEIAVTLVSDERISELNLRYLGHEGPTDVISFPLHIPGQPVLGDVYLGTDQAVRQAAELGVPVEQELLRLAIHGTLHLLGYDHPEAEDRDDSPMYRRQEALLAAFLRSSGPSR